MCISKLLCHYSLCLIFFVLCPCIVGAENLRVVPAEEIIELFNRPAPSVSEKTRDSDSRSVDESARGIAGIRAGGSENDLRVSTGQDRENSKNTEADARVISVHQFRNILFRSGSSTLKSSSYQQLDQLGQALKILMNSHPGISFSIEGHTDSIGDASSNKLLSEARSNSVRSYLIVNHIVDGERIDAVGHGEDRPIANNSTENGRRENRRVVIVKYF